MKYIDADKLIAEIERRIVETEEIGELGCANELLMLETFITSLQQEQPMPNSTELIAKWEEEKDVLKQMDFRGDEWRLAQNAFMDGVGIGLSVKQEQPEVDLEEELDQWRHKHFKGKRDGVHNGEYLERESQLDLARHFYELNKAAEEYAQDETINGLAERAFKAGAEWQRERMMENTVECDVYGYCSGWLTFGYVPECDFDFKPGDKVKLIIIKEE